jgi:hypothetical protein
VDPSGRPLTAARPVSARRLAAGTQQTSLFRNFQPRELVASRGILPEGVVEFPVSVVDDVQRLVSDFSACGIVAD